ncbi:MAG: calcium-binding protein [Planctomycetota bacterium]|nr:MAG: calcium-binding protein [Planctomycetota bacterium]
MFRHVSFWVLFLSFAIPASTQTPSTTRVSVDSAGGQAGGGILSSGSDRPAISGDGRFVTFSSDASNLVSGDTNGVTDIFVHDRQTGQTSRVSVDSAGGQGDSMSDDPSISVDGRFVAFQSWASNLVPGDTNLSVDIFVHDRQTGQTTRVSVDSVGVQGYGQSYYPSISADGRFVAFYCSSSNLVSGDTNGWGDTFVHDRQTNDTTRVSVDSAGLQGNGESWECSISGDGRVVAFISAASNLVSGDTNWARDVFVHDRQTGQTTRVSVDSAGGQGNGHCWNTSISHDGRFVAFDSIASNLVPGNVNSYEDIFVHDRQTGQIIQVSVDSLGVQGYARSDEPSISADGRFVAFQSYTNFVPGGGALDSEIYVHDRQSGQTTVVSVDSTGMHRGGLSYLSSISADGRFVAFQSSSSNLVPGDTNGLSDVFVRNPVGPPLTQSTFQRGQPAWLRTGSALPGETVWFYYSLAGLGLGPCHSQGSPCLDILDPVVMFGQATADSSGNATLNLTVPQFAPLVDVYTQAVILRGSQGTRSVTTNTITAPILP